MQGGGVITNFLGSLKGGVIPPKQINFNKFLQYYAQNTLLPLRGEGMNPRFFTLCAKSRSLRKAYPPLAKFL